MKTNKGGRPKLTTEKKSASIIIHLTLDEKKQINANATKLNLSESEYARNLVFDKLEKHPKFRMLPYEIRKELNEIKKISGLLKLLALKVKADEILKIKFQEAENRIFNSVRTAEKFILHEIMNPQFLQTLDIVIDQITCISEEDLSSGREFIKLKSLLLDLKRQHTNYYQ
ncbi:hypothetical protein Emtol_0311 (plasmid) [Emticicia oligotrophica DSM 17448]|uniref:Uncharacterized protein n=1 Tax=Emticicia oligotrophica (strain DSM 17448 / CIP 109782 / MTCC 6937 / GPTSA100-15) TaxID=929562 RepID=A0ABM5N7Q2_EMTOG|nr:hypothetical protein [Emticicia oligotrophica]AFK05578.1 hypothetical protein Emtol_0311 [Emticicia oligotrophica DSM 17448]